MAGKNKIVGKPVHGACAAVALALGSVWTGTAMTKGLPIVHDPQNLAARVEKIRDKLAHCADNADERRSQADEMIQAQWVNWPNWQNWGNWNNWNNWRNWVNWVNY